MRKSAAIFAAMAAMLWMAGCADKDPMSSQSEGTDSPTGKLVTTKNKVAGDCNVPGCRPGFGGGGSFGTRPRTRPGEMGFSHISTGELPTIDGNISEWEALFGPPHLGQANFLNQFSSGAPVPMDESDQKVEVWLGWNEQTNRLYIAARVTDNAYGTNTNGSDATSVWQSDDMEVYLDADNSGGPYDVGNAHAQQYVLNPAGTQGAVLFPLVFDNPALFAHHPQVQSAVRRKGGVYTYELALPGWDIIDTNGNGTRHNFQQNEVIGLELAFADFESNADADAVAYHAFNALNGAVSGSNNADVFTDFRLFP